jgi:hypothetical protein
MTLCIQRFTVYYSKHNFIINMLNKQVLYIMFFVLYI